MTRMPVPAVVPTALILPSRPKVFCSNSHPTTARAPPLPAVGRTRNEPRWIPEVLYFNRVVDTERLWRAIVVETRCSAGIRKKCSCCVPIVRGVVALHCAVIRAITTTEHSRTGICFLYKAVSSVTYNITSALLYCLHCSSEVHRVLTCDCSCCPRRRWGMRVG